MITSPSAQRAVVYCRISQDRSGEAAGVARQREDAETLVKLRGWELVGVHVDNDVSATSGRRRPGFDAALADIEAGRAQVLVAWTLDRLLRSRKDRDRMITTCQRREAHIALVRGSDIDMSTPSGRLVADVLGSIAEHETATKSDRQRSAQAQAARAGRRVGGRRPFGFEPDGVTVRAEEAAAVVDGYAALLAGVPLAAIARQWNDAGHRTGQNNRKGEPSPWRADSVRAVLLNPRYAGQRAYLREVVAPAAWPAIVEPETHAAAVALLTDPRRYGGGGNHARALLTGIARCWKCTATLHTGGGNGEYRTYRCSGAYGHLGRAAAPVDEYVEAVVVARLQRPDAVNLLARQDAEAPDLAALRTEALGLRARLEELAVLLADDAMTPAQFRTANERTRARLAEVEAAQADAGRVDILGPLVGVEDVQAAWDGLDIARKRAVLALLVKIVVHSPGRGARTFDPATVEITSA